MNVDQAFVNARFELLPGPLVDIGTPKHRIQRPFGRQGNRARNKRSGPFGCPDDLIRRPIQTENFTWNTSVL